MTEPRTYLDELIAGRTTISGGSLTAPISVQRVNIGLGLDVSVTDDIATISVSATLEASAKWRTERLLDFTNQSANWPLTSNPKVFTADAQYFMDDVQTAIYFAGHANLFNTTYQWSIQNGTGLVMTPNASGTSFSALTAPRLWTMMAGLRNNAPTRARINYLTSYGSTIEIHAGIFWSAGAGIETIDMSLFSNDANAGWNGYSLKRQMTGGGSDAFELSLPEQLDVAGLYMPLGARPRLLAYLQMGNASSGAMLAGELGSDALLDITPSLGLGTRCSTTTTERAGTAGFFICPEFTTHSLSAGIVIQSLLVEQFY
jgi:hypothetical protein